MKTSSRPVTALRTLLAGAAVLALPSLASAHTGTSDIGGFFCGAHHPLSGLDHLGAMIAVGLWAAQRGGRATWIVPATFVAVMTLGAAFGAAGFHLPMVEAGIVASVVVLGLLIATAAKLPVSMSAALVAVFALFHGFAHGAEMPATQSGATYGLGFVLTTALLHFGGIGFGWLAARRADGQLARYAGAVIAAGGAYLCFA